MALGSNFKRPTPAQPGAKPGAQRKSRYAGIKSAVPRDPMPHVGMYRFRVLEVEQGHNPGKAHDSFKAKLEIVELDDTAKECHREGDTVLALFMISTVAGLARSKAFVMAAAGYDDEAAYDEFDLGASGGFQECVAGEANDFAAAGLGIVDRLVDCIVTRGKNTPDNQDYYREFAWAPALEEGVQMGRVEWPDANAAQ